MLKFSAEGNGRLLVGLGLSRGNCSLLLAGRPIKINLQELGITIPLDILLFAGETEAEMKKEIRPYINNNTVVCDSSGGEA